MEKMARQYQPGALVRTRDRDWIVIPPEEDGVIRLRPVVGVTDTGDSFGLESDQFSSEDKMHLHLTNLINDKIGPQHMNNIHPRFDDYDGKRVLIVECGASKVPIFVKEGNDVRFYIRTGTSTTELNSSQTHDFIKQRFEN